MLINPWVTALKDIINMHLCLKKETCKNCGNIEQKNKHVQPIAMHKYEAQSALIIYKWGAHTTKNSGNKNSLL